jgi:hypothetical protein
VSDVDNDSAEHLRYAVNSAMDAASVAFCDELERAKRKHDLTDEQITRRLAEVDSIGPWLDWWNDWVEGEE